MKKVVLSLFLIIPGILAISQTSEKEAVNAAVTSFLDSWNSHSFQDLPKYTSEDFIYSNPRGAIMKGRIEAQKQLQNMHDGVFKGTPLTEQTREVRMIAPDAAVVMVTAIMGAAPAEQIEEQKQLRTFVLARQNGKWLLTTLQTTTILPATPTTPATSNPGSNQ
jgi:uncharacterized protein (TIGR02246 family)